MKRSDVLSNAALRSSLNFSRTVPNSETTVNSTTRTDEMIGNETATWPIYSNPNPSLGASLGRLKLLLSLTINIYRFPWRDCSRLTAFKPRIYAKCGKSPRIASV